MTCQWSRIHSFCSNNSTTRYRSSSNSTATRNRLFTYQPTSTVSNNNSHLSNNRVFMKILKCKSNKVRQQTQVSVIWNIKESYRVTQPITINNNKINITSSNWTKVLVQISTICQFNNNNSLWDNPNSNQIACESVPLQTYQGRVRVRE